MRSIVLAIVLAAGTASADDREDARREFAAGQAADQAKDWQTAIEHYLRANELVQHPFTIYNIAVDYERLGKLRESATWYARYIEQTTDATERAKVQRLIDDMKARPARLRIRSMPDAASVMIDGKPAGRAPAVATLRGGPHRISVELDGQREERDVAIEFGEAKDVLVELRSGGALFVTGSPPGAAVTIDNVAAGALPITVPTTPGSHHVHIEQAGYAPWDSDFAVQAGQTTQVNVIMAAVPGSIDTGGGGATRTIRLQYLIGAIGGADARGSGAMGLFELGARYTQYAFVFQAGGANDAGFIALLGRWSILASSLSPYIGIGLVGNRDGGGFEAELGLHWDLAKSERASLAAIATVGVYYYGSTDMSGNSGTSIAVPLSFGIEGTLGN